MSGISPEEIEWRNHARELQAAKIFENTSGEIKEEIDRECVIDPGKFWALDSLMKTPPILLPSVFERFQETEEAFYSKAAEALRLSAKQAMIVTVLASLAQVCSEAASKPKIIAFDSFKPEQAVTVEAAFRNYSGHAVLALADGRAEAIIPILESIQGETTLAGYKRNLVEKRLLTDPAEAGSSFMSIPTRLEGVDLKLTYKNTEQSPQLALIIRPLQ